MALPALSPDATTRLYFDYTSLQKEHTLIVRINEGQLAVDVLNYAANIVDTLTTVMRANDAVLGVRISNQGSNVTFPLALDPSPGQLSGSATIWDQDPESVFWSLVGRGISTGRKVRYEIFTPIRNGQWPENNRYEPGENTVVDTFRTAMTSALIVGTNSAVQANTIGGDVILINPYVNIAHNAYWQRKQRRG